MAFRCAEGTSEDQRVGGCLQGALERSHIHWKPVSWPLQPTGRGVPERKGKENKNNSSSLPAIQAPKSGILVILLGEPTVAAQGPCCLLAGVPAACWLWLAAGGAWGLWELLLLFAHLELNRRTCSTSRNKVLFSSKAGQGWRWGTPREKKASPRSI